MLTWAHLHIAVNHFPVVGAVLATLFLIWAVWRGQERDLRMALVFFVVVGAMGAGTYFTGEPAEDSLEDVVEVQRGVIHEHEEVAEGATVILVLTALAALAGLVLTRDERDLPRWFTPAFLVLALVASGAMAWTSYKGGEIRHTEIRSGSTNAQQPSEEAGEPGG